MRGKNGKKKRELGQGEANVTAAHVQLGLKREKTWVRSQKQKKQTETSGWSKVPSPKAQKQVADEQGTFTETAMSRAPR